MPTADLLLGILELSTARNEHFSRAAALAGEVPPHAIEGR